MPEFQPVDVVPGRLPDRRPTTHRLKHMTFYTRGVDSFMWSTMPCSVFALSRLRWSPIAGCRATPEKKTLISTMAGFWDALFLRGLGHRTGIAGLTGARNSCKTRTLSYGRARPAGVGHILARIQFLQGPRPQANQTGRSCVGHETCPLARWL